MHYSTECGNPCAKQTRGSTVRRSRESIPHQGEVVGVEASVRTPLPAAFGCQECAFYAVSAPEVSSRSLHNLHPGDGDDGRRSENGGGEHHHRADENHKISVGRRATVKCSDGHRRQSETQQAACGSMAMLPRAATRRQHVGDTAAACWHRRQGVRAHLWLRAPTALPTHGQK